MGRARLGRREVGCIKINDKPVRVVDKLFLPVTEERVEVERRAASGWTQAGCEQPAESRKLLALRACGVEEIACAGCERAESRKLLARAGCLFRGDETFYRVASLNIKRPLP